MRGRRLSSVVFSALLGWIALSGAASPPELIDYQGILRNAMNDPVDGSFDMEFLLYDADGGGSCTGGNLLLTDSHLTAGSGSITVTGGLFHALLGSGVITPGTSNDLGEAFRDTSNVHLELRVDGETLCPRTRMLSSGYSLNAKNVDGAGATFYLTRANHTGTQPPSTISPQGPGSGLDADTVDGLNATALMGESYSNYVVVAVSGGDYSSPLDAVANIDAGDSWCGIPSLSNRCLIRIMPGVYDLGAAVFPGALAMRSYVDIEGSGQNLTLLTASGSDILPGLPATVATATDAELRNLTVENTGGTAYAYAITGSGAGRVSRLTDVTAVVHGATNNSAGITNSNISDALPVLRDVTVSASGGGNTTGISNSCSAADIDGAVVTVTGTGQVIAINDAQCGGTAKGRITNLRATADGATHATALVANQSQTTFSNVMLIARNGSITSRGVTAASPSDFELLNSTVEADGSPSTIGLTAVAGTVRIDHCVIFAQTATIIGGSGVLVGSTKLSGGAVDGPATTCAAVYDETNTFFADTCP